MIVFLLNIHISITCVYGASTKSSYKGHSFIPLQNEDILDGIVFICLCLQTSWTPLCREK